MCTRCVFLGGVAAAFAATPAFASARTGDPQALEIAMPRMPRITDTLWLGRLSAHVWMHTTTHVLDGVGFYPANGAIVVHGDEATLIDTGWNDRDATAILAAWERTRQPAIRRALATHFHADRTGGIGALARRGIPTYGNPLTIGLAIDAKVPVPRPLHDVQKRPQRFGGLEVFYPGEGHTLDNVVAWIPSDAVLFGGCLLKSITEDDLGYLGDANVGAYAATTENVARAYPRARHAIPGHGTIAGTPLAHTIALARAATRTGAG